uniref:dATP/dGTP diphosphohydrolase N-terminal domain-containing protein n=1 Tax=viral metagenome TaxID=1070528 RepID=A0A6M3KVR4_9ZZZZ
MKDFKEVKDSGKRQEFDTGSKRDTRDGKGRFDLIPPYALTRLARHYENGAVKYGDRNWEKGQPLARYLDSMIRHAYKFLGGSREEDHLAAVAWNALAYIETEYRIELGILPAELDDIEPVRKMLNGETQEESTRD